jgi:protein gp37
MSQQSAIEWTDATWNPVTGCTEVSPGCDNCYARTFAERWRGIKGHPYEQGFDLKLWPERLSYPSRWKKPKRIFTNSMSDLFHQKVPDKFIWHTYQVLTKRPSRLLRLVPEITTLIKERTGSSIWPSYIWFGVSVETMKYAWRVEQLVKVPAQVRFISAEPLLDSLQDLDITNIHWIIAGGESGPRYRPCKPEWIRELRDKCQERNIAFFFKQWGGRTPKAGGRELDGVTWEIYPNSSIE